MSILLVSSDQDAAQALSSALARAGEVTRWERESANVSALISENHPLVLVADANDPNPAEVVSVLR